MIVLHGDPLKPEGSSIGEPIIDTSIEVTTKHNDGSSDDITIEEGQNVISSFTETWNSKISSIDLTYTITIPGAQEAEVKSVSAIVKSKQMTYNGTETPLSKKDYIEQIFNSMNKTVSVDEYGISAVFNNNNVHADITTTEHTASDIQTKIEAVDGESGKFKLTIVNDGSLLIWPEISYLSSVQIELTATKDTVSKTFKMDVDYESVLYAPKTKRASDKYLYVIEGVVKLCTGWLETDSCDVSRYEVYRVDSNPVTSFFRNKFYETYDPQYFKWDLDDFAFTAARIDDGFTLYHTVAKRSPEPFSLDGDQEAKYYSNKIPKPGEDPGTVSYVVNEGKMVVDTDKAESDLGYAVFEFSFPDSIYEKQYFYMPCKADKRPLAFAIDSKIAYDDFSSLPLPVVKSVPDFLGEKTLLHAIVKEAEAIGYGSSLLIGGLLAFFAFTRGAVLPFVMGYSLAMFLHQLILITQHNTFLKLFNGQAKNMLQHLYRSAVYQFTQCSKGLTKKQKEALFDFIISPYDDAKSRDIGGSITIGVGFYTGATSTFFYKDGFLLLPTALGGHWKYDLNEIYNETGLATDEFKALAKRHALLSHSDTFLDFKFLDRMFAFPGFGGSLTRIIKGGHINDVGGLKDEVFYTGKDWTSYNASNDDEQTMKGYIAKVMKESASSTLSRVSFGEELKNGVPPEELYRKPVPVSPENNAAINHDVAYNYIAHIDVDHNKVRIWGAGGHHDEEIDCVLLSPNPKILIAIEKD